MEHEDKPEENKAIFRKSTRVTLRPPYEEVYPHSWRWINDPRNTKFLGTRPPRHFADQGEYYESVRNSNGKQIVLIIEVDNKPIGSMGLHNIDHLHGHAETGALIGEPEYQGKGYGSEAKMLLLEYAFNVLNLRKVYSEVIAYNERSYKYSLKCGYKEEARLEEYWYYNGKYHDLAILSVNRERFEPLWEEFKVAHEDHLLI